MIWECVSEDLFTECNITECIIVYCCIVAIIVVCCVCWLCKDVSPCHQNIQHQINQAIEESKPESFFGETVPADKELIKSGLSVTDVEEEYLSDDDALVVDFNNNVDVNYKSGVTRGIDVMFDYSNRFIEDQLSGSRIYAVPPLSGLSVCR